MSPAEEQAIYDAEAKQLVKDRYVLCFWLPSGEADQSFPKMQQRWAGRDFTSRRVIYTDGGIEFWYR